MTAQAERLLDRVARTSSLDRVFVAGEEAESITDRLRLRGAVVVKSGAATIEGVTKDLCGARGTFSLAIVCLSAPDLSDEDARYLLVALRRVAQVAYVSVAAAQAGRDDVIGSRIWWERHALASGFRRHPGCTHLVLYEELDAPGVTPWVLLEAVRHPSESPLDVLRTAGTETDATLSRYVRASHFVRRHDRVLDLDCGVGAGLATIRFAVSADALVGIVRSPDDLDYATAHYGSRHVGLEFHAADLMNLSRFEDESFDVVVSCHPLSPEFWSACVLDDIDRILAPGGRLVCCVGEADLAFRYQIAARFLLERVFGQTSRPGPSWRRERSWHEVAIDRPNERPPVDFWFFVAMKDPMRGDRKTYQERQFPHTAFPGGPNPTQYVGTFTNPWLHPSVFSIGARVTRATLLEDLCRDVARTAPGSLDAAAAHCVLGYQLLEAPRVDSAAIGQWLDDVQPLLHGLTDDAPASVRWRVSLLFVAGRLAMRTGDNERALRSLRACMLEDATAFSSLLATKTIEAAYWVGFLLARRAELDAAAGAFSRGVEIAQRCIGAEAALPFSADEPMELFGFREFAQVFDLAGRCAAARLALRDGAAWESRHAALLRHASQSVDLSTSLQDARWALEDERGRAQATLFALQWQRDVRFLEFKESTNDALLRQIVHRCRLSERSVVVWGAGAAGRRVLNLVLDRGGTVDAFVDSNPAKHGTSVAGRPVIAPGMLASSEWLGSFVLIGSMHAAEIEAHLLRLGLQRHDDFMRVDLDLVGIPTA